MANTLALAEQRERHFVDRTEIMSRATRRAASAELRKTFGQNLREARQQAGLTQLQIAEAAGRERSYISDVERGLHNITMDTMVELAHVVGRDVTDLLTPAKKRSRR
jgi:ribosome-binding protein aMBF1 (putative translation factor)